ncbi:uncharacterized protein BXZ73DRAFT_103840 [Epithele typhae]|uniref:uncharacterized protein n=1 Tax=Epithele typhae TaxID=378194 RepID=UPI00200854EA|nr:uncharacterized protein BXZ73DRAFT_103840 [Epithele typhae]KAH9923402.1 hypothetical protein BXZ73DRAFT_103840 [Epithele typhae]
MHAAEVVEQDDNEAEGSDSANQDAAQGSSDDSNRDNADDEGEIDEGENGEGDSSEDDLVERNNENLRQILQNETAEWVHNELDHNPDFPSLDPDPSSTPPSSYRSSQHATARTRESDITTKKHSRSRTNHIPQRKPESPGARIPDRRGLKRTLRTDESGSEGDSYRTKSKPPRKKTKQPIFIDILDDDTSDEQRTHKKARYEENSSLEEDIEDQESIELVRSSSGHYNLLEQPLRVKRVAEGAITQIEYYLVLKNAFPDGPTKYNVAIRQILVKIKTDASYAKKIATIPAQRIPIFRGRVKSNVTALSDGLFNVDSEDEKKIDWLIEKDRFIYRCDYENNIVHGGEPFSDPIFAKMLRLSFFKRSSHIGYAVMDSLSSSVASKPDEKEISAPMLALVATTVYAGLLDLKAGKEQDFRGNLFSDKYDDVIDALKEIRDQNVMKYHSLMHDFYQTVTTSSGREGRSTARRSNAKQTFLDVSAMRGG